MYSISFFLFVTMATRARRKLTKPERVPMQVREQTKVKCQIVTNSKATCNFKVPNAIWLEKNKPGKCYAFQHFEQVW